MLHRTRPSLPLQAASRPARRAAAPVRAAASRRDTIVPPPSYRIPAVWLGLNAATAAAQVVLGGASPASQLPGFLLASLLPVFLATRASAVQFVFGPDALEVVTAAKGDDTENRFVGGANRWPYASFINWEFFPSPSVPILVYFKESQTKPEGQIHFFPVLFDAATLLGVMRERCGPSVNSGA
jgi:hypothetical protein